ncbi:NeuD/PglB/VioB family sugar acetyltransferase [Sansalvadorimonas sp. 2012CJ34-2]|uniref:NeuD/PglB/VioB family sugar acetyltransferase n=1 Tax=Parendozoicomonas callyspongiae TaxID=2942213 RepID=A0ABT0PLF2_9GAMM|nr:NeuD/PglB/VioB family sugar acetyltransferase [Sansalvadorimonas sp. 2012CJ34-2]MCL6272205.1 NeuD/PglB/VioB family sugar acetyltransferase [Sansalvadorimonas sp. 2012CJ34-2]
MNKSYAVYGAGGFGREVMPLLLDQLDIAQELDPQIYFIDDLKDGEIINDIPVISFESFINLNTKERYITIAITNSKVREELNDKCLHYNINILNIYARNVTKLANVEIGASAILCPFVTVTSNIKIGKSFHANIYSYVAHDCIIGDYVTFAPSVKCNGNVEIDDHVYIGTGAIIKQGKENKPLKIGKGAIISAGAFVTKDVPAGVTVFGNPAIELTKENLRKRNG